MEALSKVGQFVLRTRQHTDLGDYIPHDFVTLGPGRGVVASKVPHN